MTTQELAQKIKQKYPEYKNVDDTQLVNKIVEKYPVYKTHLDDFSSQPTQDNTNVTNSQETTQQATPPAMQPPAEYKPSFEAQQNDGFWSSVGKTVANIPSSAANLGKNLYQIVRHPLDTAKNIGAVGAGAIQAGSEALFGNDPNVQKTQTQLENDQAFNSAKDYFVNRFGGMDKIKQTIVNDPVGFAADFATVLEGGGGMLKGAGAVSKVDALSTAGRTISKVGETVNPIRQALPLASKVVSGTGNLIKKTAGFATSQATGLNPETISQIIKTPNAFNASEAALMDRGTLANQVKTAIDTRLTALSETGANYQSVRESGAITSIPQKTFQSVLSKYGLKLDDAGKIIRDRASVPMKTGDVSALQDFLDIYGKEGDLNANEFLNTRKAAAAIADFDTTKSDIANKIGEDLYATLNDVARKKIDGLEALDAQYSPEVKLLKQIKKDYLAPDGTLKDGAINKIANLTGKGKDKVVSRLEQIVPDIKEQVNILKALEGIQVAEGQKVGTYFRSAMAGGGLITGNIPAIAVAIVAQPSVAVPILRAYGKILGGVGDISEPIITKIKSGKTLLPKERTFVTRALKQFGPSFMNVAGSVNAQTPNKDYK